MKTFEEAVAEANAAGRFVFTMSQHAGGKWHCCTRSIDGDELCWGDDQDSPAAAVDDSVKKTLEHRVNVQQAIELSHQRSSGKGETRRIEGPKIDVQSQPRKPKRSVDDYF